MIDLKGRKALITGGSRGIGKATAELFARAEGDVAISNVCNWQAADIAGPILFLASGLARHITGEVLNVNGGSVLCA